MAFCTQCGKQLPTNGQFCGGCGTRIVRTAPSITAPLAEPRRDQNNDPPIYTDSTVQNSSGTRGLTNTESSVEVRWAWAIAIPVTVLGTVMFRNENIAGSLGSTAAGLVLGFLLSPIWWGISRIFSKAKWHWYHWFNSAVFTCLIIAMFQWFFADFIQRRVSEELAVSASLPNATQPVTSAPDAASVDAATNATEPVISTPDAASVDAAARSARDDADRQNSNGLLEKGISYGKAGQFARELEAYREALRINPKNAIAWIRLGQTYGNTNQYEKAIDAYTEALKVDPKNELALTGVGTMYSSNGQSARALEAFREAIRIDPKKASSWLGLGWAYLGTGQTAQAKDSYTEAIRIDPNLSFAKYALDELNKNFQTIESSRAAIGINPKNAEEWRKLGMAYFATGQSARAIEAYSQAVRIDPNNGMTWLLWGNAYSDGDQSDHAITAYREGIRLNPKGSIGWLWLALEYRKANQFSQAAEAYCTAVGDYPKDAFVWFSLGEAYEKSGQYTMAKDAYQKAQELDPKFVPPDMTGATSLSAKD